MLDAFPPKAEATGSNPVGCTSFPRENAPGPADICENVQEHARPKLERAYKARSTHTPEHVARVAAIIADYPDARTTGLPSAVDELWARLGCEDPAPEIAVVPDAFRLNEEASEIELYEVEVTHPLTTRKLRTLGEWWSAWDAEAGHDWLPVLIQVDRFGDRHRRDLGIAYFETLGAAA